MTDNSNTAPVDTPDKNKIIANGVNARGGAYALPPMTPEEFQAGLQGQKPEPDAKSIKGYLAMRQQRNFALKEGLDPTDLKQAGWGIVFPVDTDPQIIEAMRPLMNWRKEQAGDLYKEYLDKPKGAVRPMSIDTYASWIGRNGADNYGPVEPEKIPYYLLLVGDPNQIDYRFQYQLDVQYGVGRICFDKPEDYANYAQSVIQAEKQQKVRSRRITFFGTANSDDYATNLSANQLVRPLTDFAASLKMNNAAPWQVQSIIGDGATKSQLGRLLGGADTPGMLFTASHGMGFPLGDAQQMAQQGSLLCQDWPGPVSWRKDIPQDFYFAADDLAGDAGLLGLVAFFFACYGAGTPQFDEFYKIAFTDRAAIANQPFIAPLPKRLLAHPKGGALAVVGHVERAWGYSFTVDNMASLAAFRSALQALMSGAPIGHAFEYFNMRYAQFTTDLAQMIMMQDYNPPAPIDLANTWTAVNDAKNYVVLGDPAVRVQVPAQSTDQPVAAEPISLTSSAPGVPTAAPAPATAAVPATATVTATVTFPVTAAVPAAAPAAPSPAAVVGAAAGAAASPAGGEQPANYGALDNLLQGVNVNAILNQLIQKVTSFLGAAIDNAVTLEVSTYTAPDMTKVTIQGSQITGADLRATTLVRIDGDIKQILPMTSDGELDTTMWNMHLQMVQQAHQGRADLLRSAVTSVSSFLNIGGLK